jgi:hypothetical protein
MLSGKVGARLDMRMPVFQDVNGAKIAINPDNVVSVVGGERGGEKFTDINFVGGGAIRVPLSLENTIARLVGAQELGPE